MGVYSDRLFLGNVPAGGPMNLFTGPTGITTVIRDLSFIPFGGVTPWTIFFAINGIYFALFDVAVPTSGVHQECRVVMNPGDVLSAVTGTGGFDGAVTGYRLT